MEESVEDPSGVTASSNWFEPVGAGYGAGTTGRNRDVPPAHRGRRREPVSIITILIIIILVLLALYLIRRVV